MLRFRIEDIETDVLTKLEKPSVVNVHEVNDCRVDVWQKTQYLDAYVSVCAGKWVENENEVRLYMSIQEAKELRDRLNQELHRYDATLE